MLPHPSLPTPRHSPSFPRNFRQGHSPMVVDLLQGDFQDDMVSSGRMDRTGTVSRPSSTSAWVGQHALLFDLGHAPTPPAFLLLASTVYP